MFIVDLNTTVDSEGETEIGKSTRPSLEDCTASGAEHLCIGCGYPETDRSYCVIQHANMRMLVQGHPTPDPANIQLGKWGVYMRTNKNPFPKVDRVRPSHPTVANPRFGAVSAVIRACRAGRNRVFQPISSRFPRPALPAPNSRLNDRNRCIAGVEGRGCDRQLHALSQSVKLIWPLL
jgi:hypothetical protein